MDEGELIKSSPDITVSFLRQEFREELREERTLKDEFLSTFDKVMALEAEYAQCEKDLADVGDDAERMQSLLDRMASLQTELETADATAVERKVDKVLGAMGFTKEDAALPVSAFSGGWKMRIGLGKILLQEPQVRNSCSSTASTRSTAPINTATTTLTLILSPYRHCRCFSSTSRPTTWTSNRSSGWRGI